jgi:hypothetical protein
LLLWVTTQYLILLLESWPSAIFKLLILLWNPSGTINMNQRKCKQWRTSSCVRYTYCNFLALQVINWLVIPSSYNRIVPTLSIPLPGPKNQQGKMPHGLMRFLDWVWTTH